MEVLEALEGLEGIDVEADKQASAWYQTKEKKRKKGKITVFLPYFDDNNVDETPKNPLQQWR